MLEYLFSLVFFSTRLCELLKQLKLYWNKCLPQHATTEWRTTFPKVVRFIFKLKIFPYLYLEIVWLSRFSRQLQINFLCTLDDVVHWNWWMQSLVKENANWLASIRLQSAASQIYIYFFLPRLFLRLEKLSCVLCVSSAMCGFMAVGEMLCLNLFVQSPLFWWK